MTRPQGETRQDRMRQRLLGLVVVVALVSLLGNIVQTHQSITSGNRHHAASAQQQSTIISLNKEIATLLKQHSVTFAQEKQQLASAALYDADVLNFAKTLEGQLVAICAATDSACPTLPPLPS